MRENTIWIFTFGQNHYKIDGTAMKDYWITIEGTYEQARSRMCRWAKEEMGDEQRWSWMYQEHEFNPLFFPKGEYAFFRKRYFNVPVEEQENF